MTTAEKFKKKLSVLLTYLVHHKTLDLPLEDLHASSGDHRADIRHNNLAKNVTDKPMVPLEASSCCVLYWETIIVIWTEEKHKTESIREDGVGVQINTWSEEIILKTPSKHFKPWSANSQTWLATLCSTSYIPAGALSKEKKHFWCKLTIRVFSRLNAHIRLSFVHTTLPLSALLFHCCLGPVLGVDIGQVGWWVVVSLQGVIVLNLTRIKSSLEVVYKEYRFK